MIIPIKMSFNRDGMKLSEETIEILPKHFLDAVINDAIEYIESLSIQEAQNEKTHSKSGAVRRD